MVVKIDEKLPMMKLSGVCREHNRNYLIYRDQSTRAKVLLEALLPDPRVFFLRGTPVCSGRPTDVTKTAMIEVNEYAYFVKQYLNQGRFYGMKNIFRASKAYKAFRMGRLLLASGIPTPLPIVSLEERCKRVLGEAYLLVPFVQGSQKLLDLWPSLSDSNRETVLESLSRILGKMHSNGILHGDLNWRNILVRLGPAQKTEFFIVDLDGSILMKRHDRSRLIMDLKHFRRDMERLDVESGLQSYFFERWKHHLYESANNLKSID